MTTDHCCPRCQGELSDEKALAGHLKCTSCGKHVPLEVAAPDLTQYLLYTLSLPERTVRSTVALLPKSRSICYESLNRPLMG